MGHVGGGTGARPSGQVRTSCSPPTSLDRQPWQSRGRVLVRANIAPCRPGNKLASTRFSSKAAEARGEVSANQFPLIGPVPDTISDSAQDQFFPWSLNEAGFSGWGSCCLFYLICTGCGETFRPIIIPNPPTFPTAKRHTLWLRISDNGAIVPGSAMVIDVSRRYDVSPSQRGPCSRPRGAANREPGAGCKPLRDWRAGRFDYQARLQRYDDQHCYPHQSAANSAPNFVAVAPYGIRLAYVTVAELRSSFRSGCGQHSLPTDVIWTIPVGPKARCPSRHARQKQTVRGEPGRRHAQRLQIPLDRSARPITGALTLAPFGLSGSF